MDLRRGPLFNLYISAVVFVSVIVISTVGYMLIEQYTFLEALFMTVITLSTVGYAEVHPLSTPGRIFTILLIFANLGTVAFFLSQVSRFFFDGEFIKTYKLYKMRKAINELEGHIIICGFGRNGREAAKIFHNSNKEFVVIERAGSEVNDMPFEVKHYIYGDATRDEVLIDAGLHKAKALITTLPDDASNLFVVLTARELNPKIKIISRASNDTSVKKITTAGANNVIMPDKIGGAHMATLVLNPDVSEFVDLMASTNGTGFKILEIQASVNTTLAELDCWKKTGATVLGLKQHNGEYVLNPSGTTAVYRGTSLIVMGSKDQLNNVKQLLSE